jgi:hypothetical protein
MFSTLDLCGKGGFTLLTGIDGEGWKKAAVGVRRLGLISGGALLVLDLVFTICISIGVNTAG